ncbi:MAG: hypothetical protein LM589_02325 [Thermosphaera sp.]|nr:hypothetical protein [Thermosphaera sp.]
MRAEEMEIELTNEALEKLVELGVKKSLRYAVQLMEPARILAETRGSSKIEARDVENASKLFIDVSVSVEYLKQYEEKFMKQ